MKAWYNTDMSILRVLFVIVILFSGYVSAAHGHGVEIAAIDCCEHQGEDSGCNEGSCGGCLVQAAVMTGMALPAVFTKPALEALPAPVLARDAPPFHLRPPEILA